MRHLCALALVVLAAIAAVGTASASGPVITFADDPAPVPIADWGDCPTFQIDALFMANRRNETFYDSQGNPTLQRRHVSFTGTLYNASNPAHSVTYSGDFTRTLDYTTNILTITGLNSRVVLPGSGVVFLAAGDVQIDRTTGDTVTHGPDGDMAQLCAALS